MLTWDLASRLLAILTTAVVAIISTDSDGRWVGLVIAFGFSHYLLSLYYAGRSIRSLVRDASAALPLSLLLLLGGVLYFLDFPLIVYFGIHHACNEAYLRRFHHGRASAASSALAGSRALFHGAAYFVIIRQEAELNAIPDAVLWTGFILAALVYARQLLVEFPGKNLSQLLRETALEGLVLLLVLLSLEVRITFLQVVFYHFALWVIAPIPVLRRQGRARLAEYVLLTVGSLLGFITLIMTQMLGSTGGLSFWYAQFIFWSYVHITTSFALSPAHPECIVRLFRPQHV